MSMANQTTHPSPSPCPSQLWCSPPPPPPSSVSFSIISTISRPTTSPNHLLKLSPIQIIKNQEYLSPLLYAMTNGAVEFDSPTFSLMRLRRRQYIPSCASHHRVDEDEIYWDAKKQDEESALSHNSPHVISQLAQCFTNAMVGPRAWIGGIFTRSSNKRFGSGKFLDYPFGPHQEERLRRLQERIGIPFDETCIDHQEALHALWDLSFPNVKLKGLISDQWKDMGWQGVNPATDFRGCGFISLENLLFFARTYPASFHRLLFKQTGERAKWEYPFAVAGINVSFMLIQMLDLYSVKPKCLPGNNFIKLLGEDEEAFDVLYCIAFAMMDAQWLAMHASYMDFNEVLRVTRTQLERELSLEDVHRIQDLPAFNLLYH